MADIFDQIAPDGNQAAAVMPPPIQGDIFDQVAPEAGFNEGDFQKWYSDISKKTGLNPDPDDPRHHYNYRAAYKAGALPNESGHWPSQFKKADHPNRFVDGIDTITGKPRQGDIFDQVATEKPKPALDDPAYLKKISLPKSIDAEKWEKGVKEIEAQGERIKNALLNPEAPYGAVETALHIGSMMAGVPAMGFGHIVDLITDGKYKVAEKIGEKMIYEPHTESGEVIRDILFSPYTLASKIGKERSDTLFDELVKKYGPDDVRTTLYPTIRKTLWDIIGIVASGKGMHVPGAETAKLPEGGEVPKLDTTFAKDEILTRMAVEKTKGVQRPLDLLARKEAGLKGEVNIDLEKAPEIEGIDAAERIRQAEHDQKQSELNQLFESVPYSATDIVEKAPEKLPISTNIRTLRGAIKEIGGINFLNFKGELKEMPVDVKYLSIKDGVPIDLAVNQLKDDGWLDPSTTVQSFMEDLRTRPEILREDRITRDVSEKKVHELSPQEKRFQEEMAWQPEEPPEGKYVTMRAEDLPEGKKIVLIDNKTAAGWDIYEVQEKDPFSITLVDGETIELKPLDKVQVLKEDIEAKKLRPIKEIIADVNKLIGERGQLSIKGESLTPEQQATYIRLSGDLEVIKERAARTGKTVKRYLTDIKVDPAVATMLARDAGDITKYAKSVNLQKQDIPEDLKHFEMDIAADSPKKVQTWDETGRLSANLRGDYRRMARVMEKAKNREGVSAVETDAVRQVNVNIIYKLKEDVLNQTPEQFAKSYKYYKENVFEAVSNAASEAGRALNIHKKTISFERMARAFNGLKRNLNPREMREFKDLNLDDPIEVKRFIDRLGDPSVKDYFIEYWYNQILSGPPTHLVNTISNTGWALFQVPHRFLSALVDMPYSRLTGRPRTRYLNETVPIFAGYKSGFSRGRKAAWQTVRYNKITDFETKWAMDIGHAKDAFERSPNEMLRKAAPFITWPSRMLRGMDVWANSIAYDAHARVLARRAANEKGISGKSRAAFEKKYIENLSDADHQECLKQAAYNTFMDDPDPFTKWLLGVRKVPVVGPASQFVVPFVNTISNLTKRGMEMTPGLGIVKEAVSRGMGRGQATPEVIAKQIEGALIAMYILYKADVGEITGPLPENKSEREAFYRQGKKPWGIRIGKTWYQYRRIEPFNTVIASVAITHEKIKNAKDDETATQIFTHVANGVKDNLIDSSYMQGVQQIFDKYGSAKGAIQRHLASWVPYSSFWRSINRAYEVATEGKTKVREGNEWLKSFSQVIPGLSGEMPAKLDLWGNEIELPGGVFRQWLPYKWSEGTTDPVEKELERLQVYPGKPKQTIRVKGEDVKLTDEQYRDYCLDFGQNAKKKVKILMSEPDYAKYKDQQKIEKMNGRLKVARNQALARMKRQLRGE